MFFSLKTYQRNFIIYNSNIQYKVKLFINLIILNVDHFVTFLVTDHFSKIFGNVNEKSTKIFWKKT